jgi:hypothetical protein
VASRFLVRGDRPPRGPAFRTRRHSPRQPRLVGSIGSATTVWPCGDDWLTTAVAKTVTTYTAPGDRVLLLPTGLAPDLAGRYALLGDTGWTVVRLGRSVVAEPDSDTDGFALVLMAVHPRHSRIPDTCGERLLRPGGVLAVLTHTEEIDGHLRDRTTAIIRSAHAAGLRYHDHVILLRNGTEPHTNLLVFVKAARSSDE